MEKKKSTKAMLPIEGIISRILVIRGQKIIMDRDLALLYGVETRALKQAVKRNTKRFPPDFMFVLNKREVDQMVSQNVIPSKSYFGGSSPMAFTEQGVAMLSSVLNSDRAIEVNIMIMRAFVKLREIITGHKKIESKIRDFERKLNEQEDKIVQIIEVINQLMTPPDPPKNKIGFRIEPD